MPFVTKTEYEAGCDRLGKATAEIDQILNAAGEERALTEEERGQVDALETEIKGLDADRIAYDDDRKRRQRQADRVKALSETARSPHQREPLDNPDRSAEDLVAADRRMAIRAVSRVGRLRAFRGEEAEWNAYVSGQWLLAHLAPNPEYRTKAQEWLREHLAGAATVMTSGGALVPDQFEAAIIDLREQYGVFRANAKIEQMDGDTKIVPRRTSGLTAYFVGENSEVTASDKGWDQVELTARKIACLSKFSSELSDDAVISIADDLANEMAYAFASTEDDCGFLGNGSSTYGGTVGLITACTTATATTVTAATGNTAFATLDLADFEGMVGKLPQYADTMNAKWYISKAGWAASMLRLIDAAGGNTGAMLAGTAPKSFLGYPVVISQKMNSTLTAQTSTYGLCYLGDLSLAATLGNRRGVTIKQSDQRYLEYDQLAVLGTERFAINVHDVGDTSSAGPIIMLATPAS